MAEAMAAFPSADDLAAYLRNLEYPLLDYLASLFEGTLDDPAMAMLFQGVSWVLLCFAPEGTRPAPVEAELLLDRLKGHLETLSGPANAQSPGGPKAWLQQSRQPALLQLVLGLLIELNTHQPKEQQAPPSQRALVMAAVAAVVDAMDLAARRGP